MSDLKSKLPNFDEITSMASKFFKDMKASVTEIIGDYKNKRETAETVTPDTTSVQKPTTVVTEETVVKEKNVKPKPTKPKKSTFVESSAIDDKKDS